MLGNNRAFVFILQRSDLFLCSVSFLDKGDVDYYYYTWFVAIRQNGSLHKMATEVMS